jgi:hypothetical protein
MTNRQQLVSWVVNTLREAAWAPLGVLGPYAIGLAFGLFKLILPHENISDFFAGTQIVRGLQDTIVDLSVGLFGALVFSLFYRRQR